MDIEHLVIGCALHNTQAAVGVSELVPDDFETGPGRIMLAAIQRMLKDGLKIDLVTLDAHTNCQYTDWLIAANHAGALTFGWPQHIATLKERTRRRAIAVAANRLANAAVDMQADVDDAAVELAHNLHKLTTGNTRTVSAYEAVSQLMDSFNEKIERRAYFGVGRLDESLGGLFGGKLVVVGARPATGKSALALSAALATQQSGAVLFCSYEMAPVEIMGRAMATLARVNARDIAHREVGLDGLDAMTKQFTRASDLNLHITTSANTPRKVRAEALRLKKDQELTLIVVDYLQLMSSGQRAESRRVEVGQISRALKQLALEINVPILALSQLNRQSEQAKTKEPSMAELRESGDLEQDADVIVLMYVPEPEQDHVRGIKAMGYSTVRLLVEKNRQGLSGQRIDVVFDGGHMEFKKVSEVLGREPNL